MRLLQVVQSGEMAGGQRVCLEIVRDAVERGDDVMVTSPSPGSFLDGLPPGVQREVMPIGRVTDFGAVRAARRLAMSFRPDIVHTHTTVLGHVFWRVASPGSASVVNHVHVDHFFGSHFLRRHAMKALERATQGRVSRFIAVSENTAKGLRALGVSNERITLIRNAALVPAAPGGSGKKPGSAPVIGCVGRLCPNKGQRELIRALSELQPRFPGTELWLVGNEQVPGGKYELLLRREVQELGLERQVRFLGFREDVASLFREMDLLALPSFCEAMPLVVLEAMASGVAVVATRVGGVSEVVEDGRTGLLVEAGDVSGLAGSIGNLLGDDELRKRLASEGRRRIETDFSAETMRAAVRSVYREVLKLA